MKNKKALIVVDVQKDFCQNGALAVPAGDEVVPVINDLMESKEYDLVVATLDWHPLNHKSFASNNEIDGKAVPVGSMGELGGMPQVMWPNHCVMNTDGAKTHKDLHTEKVHRFFTKGSNKDIDSYSGFFDNDKKSSTGLGEWLKQKGITEVDVVGLALDYCVMATAVDAKTLGFKTNVIENATRAVNLSPDDGAKALVTLKEKGIEIK